MGIPTYIAFRKVPKHQRDKLERFTLKKAKKLNHFKMYITDCRIVIDRVCATNEGFAIWNVRMSFFVMEGYLKGFHHPGIISGTNPFVAIKEAFDSAFHKAQTIVDKYKSHRPSHRLLQEKDQIAAEWPGESLGMFVNENKEKNNEKFY